MARGLKTYVTSIGFFDLAVAAPSMKAALEAWGVRRNLFHQGLAWETDDPAIVKATMAKPGMVLKRAVGTKAPFREESELPTELPAAGTRPAGPGKTSRKKGRAASSQQSEKAGKAAVIQFEKEKARRERERAREEADRAKHEAAEAKKAREREREAERIKMQIEKARERHQSALADIQDQRATLDRRADAEKRRWALEKERLEDQLKNL